ncbi:MAG: haloacid dehalogenase-like hydrolase [Sulfurovaceae bacterium]|nr:haloacid dehalogenase-like hydrolase [Sulfurovaceae bacterium]
MRLALFDFDGTITTKDSMVEFILYAVGKKAYYWGLIKLSPILIAYKLKLYANDKAKEKFLAHFFKKMSLKKFQAMVIGYSQDELEKIVRKEATEKILWHKKQGDEVVVVSASMECWLKDWCDRQNIKLIATQMEIVEGKFTGKFATKNCYGKEKVNRIRALYCMEDYSCIYAYGDSQGDRELLALADKSFYKPFR